MLPKFPRGDTGALTGGQCLQGALDLYDVAGFIRQRYIDLQAEVRRGATRVTPARGD